MGVTKRKIGFESTEGAKEIPPTFCWSLSDVVAEELDCDIVISKFELQSRYCVPFQTNILGKVMGPFIPPAMG